MATQTSSKTKAVPYQVAWHWKDEPHRTPHDEVEATNATRAISKAIKPLLEEYAATKADIIIEEVYRI